MALRNVIKNDLENEFLRKNSKIVKNFDKSLWQLLDDMKETMHHNDGVGIAAVQVGVLKRAIIVETNNMFLELINPQIIYEEGEDIMEEGCLSVVKQRGYVKRPMQITVKAMDRYGYTFTLTCEKYLARVLCHEIDHLDGILFIDKVIKSCEGEN